MIRKFLTAALAIMLSAVPMKVAAKSEGIRKIGQQEHISTSNESLPVIYDGQEGRVYYGEEGIDVLLEDKHFHLDTDFAVNSLLVVDDINADGFPEFVTWQKTPSLSDQVIVVSGKNGEILDSLRYTYEFFDDEIGFSECSSMIQCFASYQPGKVLIVSDYDVHLYDLVSKSEAASFSAPDNLWDIEQIWDRDGNGTNDLALCCQNGTLYIVSGDDLTLIEQIQLGKVLRKTVENYRTFNYIAQMNLWDLHYDGNALYVTSENGRLYRLDETGQREFEIGAMNDEELMNRLVEGGGMWIYRDTFYQEDSDVQQIKTGRTSWGYMSYVIVDETDDYLLIQSYMNSMSEELLRDTGYPKVLSVFDKKQEMLVGTISLEGKNTLPYQKTCFGKNGEEDVLCVVTDSSEGGKISLYSLQGEQQLQKSLNLGEVMSVQTMAAISWRNNRYYLEVFNGPTVVLDEKLEISGYLFDSTQVNFWENDGERFLFKKNVNGLFTQLQCFDRKMDLLWQYQLNADYENQGIKHISSGRYNKDEINDYLLLVGKHDKEGAEICTYFIVIDGASGRELLNRNLKLGTYYDEKNKKHDYYLTASEAELIRDIDKDGKAEILCNSNTFITSKRFKNNGNISEYIEASGRQENIGDVNGDGFSDFVVINNKESRLFTSRLSYSGGMYMVQYNKTKIARTNDQKWENEIYAKTFGDINNDGVREIIHMSQNAKGYQVFTVTDGKTLKDMYALVPNGVKDRYERFKVMECDLNQDGYNELIGGESYNNTDIYDGKTGEIIIRNIYPYYYGDEKNYEDDYHPDYIVQFNEYEEEGNSFVGADYNGDGLNDFVVGQYRYDEQTDYNAAFHIFVYANGTLELIEDKIIAAVQNVGFLKPLKGNRNMVLMNDSNKTSIIDLSTWEVKASYDKNIDDGYSLDEDHFLGLIYPSEAYIFNSESDFEVLSEIPEIQQENILQLSWKGLSDFSIMTVTDNGTTVYKGQESGCEFRLLQGKHVISLNMDDGRGKTSTRSFTVEIQPQQKVLVPYIVTTAVLLLLILVLCFYRKIRVRRAGKAVSR